ncbi:hypothetical protein L484_002335 [Morus notabilis]|uniref:Uncharacterized protein n=1 Tax=Morus notabilis TaxID=981085 RepID=W9R0F8_9ROSA|nr:hypothetical protein L484_002335 [Morus notabilis]
MVTAYCIDDVFAEQIMKGGGTMETKNIDVTIINNIGDALAEQIGDKKNDKKAFLGEKDSLHERNKEKDIGTNKMGEDSTATGAIQDSEARKIAGICKGHEQAVLFASMRSGGMPDSSVKNRKMSWVENSLPLQIARLSSKAKNVTKKRKDGRDEKNKENNR